MPARIKLLRSSTPGAVPASLESGQIAINEADGKLFWRRADDTVGTADLNIEAQIDQALADLVNAAPVALDTLQELSAALGNDANFATTIANALAGKAALSHGHAIGDVSGLQSALDVTVPNARGISVAGLATGGGDLSADRTITVPAATDAEAEAGTDNTKAMTPLRVAQAIAALGATVADVQVFTSSGTWDKPTDKTVAIVFCWGGGGSGSKHTGNSNGAGGGGACIYRLIPISSLPSQVTVTIGAGGLGPSTNAPGSNGGNTSFGSFVTAYGGQGGFQGGNGGRGAGWFSDGGPTTVEGIEADFGGGLAGTGGLPGRRSVFGGGGGGNGNNGVTDGGASVWGGGGGGGAGGSARFGGASLFAGAGGDGFISTSGGDGAAPGGGGGATKSGTKAGDGGRGECWVISI